MPIFILYCTHYCADFYRSALVEIEFTFHHFFRLYASSDVLNLIFLLVFFHLLLICIVAFFVTPLFFFCQNLIIATCRQEFRSNFHRRRVLRRLLYTSTIISITNVTKLIISPSNRTVKAPSMWPNVKTLRVGFRSSPSRSRMWYNTVTLYWKSLYNFWMMPASRMNIIKLLNRLSSGNPRSLIISNGFANIFFGNANTLWIDLLKINTRFVRITRFPFATALRFSSVGQNNSDSPLYKRLIILSYGLSFSNQSSYSSRPPAI